ncbi:MAG: hypothetical protein ACFFDM_10665 [Candidatus Thorarchaeota archaeon]
MKFILRVFIESKSQTLVAADMDTVGHPICTGTNTSDWGNATGKASRVIPEEHRILLDAASRAAEKLGCKIEVIDIASLGFMERRKVKGVIPRIEIGEQTIIGLPMSDEIVEITKGLTLEIDPLNS